MASPFHYFRKNQKLFLVVATGLAMFVFILADPLSNMIQQMAGVTPGNTGKKTVAEWDGGSINEQQLAGLARRRYFISGFLRNLKIAGAQRILEEGGTPLEPSVPNFILNDNPPPGSVEADVVTRHIFAELAQEAGMTVSDKLLNHYLDELSFRRVSGAEIRSLLRSYQGEGGVRGAEEQLFSGLREMLLGEYYLKSYGSAIRNVLPEQRWQDWLLINERIALEAAILPADQFLSKTEEPTDDELKKFYESNKERTAGTILLVAGVPLPSPDPGFKEPRRVRVQYLMGDVTTWTEKLLDTVTEEEIADYYERNKRTQFVKSEDTSAPADETEETSEDSPETEESANTEEPAEETNDSTEPADEAEATDSEPAESPEQPAADESGRVQSASPFRLTAFQEEGDSESSDEDTTDDSAETTEEAASEEPEDSTSDAEEESLEFEPLESVTKEIRRQLANDKAVVELKRVMELSYAELQSEYNDYGGQVITAQTQEKETPAPPAKLADLSILAKEHGLVHESTTALTGRELADTFVGKAIDSQTQRQTVTRAVFTNLKPYEPFLAQDLDGQWYLVMKVEDQPSSVPSFDDVRSQVVSAWKQNKAAEIAAETAKKLAKEAQEAGGSLATFMIGKGYEVVTTDLFSARTFGTTPMEMRAGARLGEAPPLTEIGLDFIDEAFQLDAEQVVALQNYNHSNAYVVRLDRREKTAEELRGLFLKEANNWYGGRMMMAARWQYAQQQLQEQLHERVGLNSEEFAEYLQEISR